MGFTNLTVTYSIPLTIPGCVCWLDANASNSLYTDSSGTTPVSADGDPVGMWRDLSGRNNHFTQSSGTNKPAYKSNSSFGKAAVSFDGTSDYMSVPSSTSTFNFLNTSDSTIFIVFRAGVVSNPATAYHILDNCSLNGSTGARAGIGIYWDDTASNNNATYMVAFSPGLSLYNTANNTMKPNTYCVASYVSQPTNGTAANRSYIRVNGGSAFQTNTQTGSASGTPTYNLTMGNEAGAGIFTYALNGSVAEMIIYNSALSDTNRAYIENYLISKWNTTNPYYLDTDAAAFTIAAGITDGTQVAAISYLVADLKNTGLWTKMNAIYPFVGGTATTHKFNLKDPRDLDAAFRMNFTGGWTHNSNGVTGNGSNTVGDTLLTPSTTLTSNNNHFSLYTRTVPIESAWDFGSNISANQTMQCYLNYTSIGAVVRIQQEGGTDITVSATPSAGHYIASRIAANNFFAYSPFGLSTTNTANSTGTLPNLTLKLGTLGNYGTFASKNYAFLTIGSGLSTIDAANLSTIVQQYQTVLGRQVTDPAYTAFIAATGITDPTQQSAIAYLIANLKAYGLWNLMTAIYPFVGGTAATHAVNLKTPGTYNITWYGTVTHNSNGVTGDGSTGYGDTGYLINTATSWHWSIYSRDTLNNFPFALRNAGGGGSGFGLSYSGSTAIYYIGSTITHISANISSPIGFFAGSRTSSTYSSAFYGGTKVGVNTTNPSDLLTGCSNFILARNFVGSGASGFSTNNLAFTSIGGGLTDLDTQNLNNIVQQYQTILNRQVDQDGINFINAAGITNQNQQNAIFYLVANLKAYGLWDSMIAIYPFVGGTSATNAVNLKSPGTYNITWSGSITHNTNGVTGAGGFGNTGIAPSSVWSSGNNAHLSVYSRSDLGAGVTYAEFGVQGSNSSFGTQLGCKLNDGRFYGSIGNDSASNATVTRGDGFFICTRTYPSLISGYRNGTNLFNGTTSVLGLPPVNLYLLSYNQNGTQIYISYRNLAFASVGTGLSAVDATNFYNIIEQYQTLLYRQADQDIVNFLTATGISDLTQQNAVSYLVGALKAYGLWTKMTAIYPLVGGTSGTHAVNLKTPGTYNITWSGSFTHNSNGVTGNGGYGLTGLTPSTALSLNSVHLSFYKRTNGSTSTYDIGVSDGTSQLITLARSNGLFYSFCNNLTALNYTNVSNLIGMFSTGRTDSSNVKFYYRGSNVSTQTAATIALPTLPLTVLGYNNNGANSNASNDSYSFLSIGSGLTDTEASNFYNIVQQYQTILSRQI